MKRERLFTTREVAEMWNVSPSTIKRWADSQVLRCQRTPGGHRKFSMRDISEFQSRQGFEATGLLSTENWEDPEIELAVNQKKFDRLHDEILRLAIQNQRIRIKQLLERLHIRGLEFSDLYDQIVIPILHNAADQLNGEISDGHMRLLLNNLDEAVFSLLPQVTRRRPSNKIALCGSNESTSRLQVNAMARILELDGWDAFNLGEDVSFELMADLVKREPVDLVCITSARIEDYDEAARSYDSLREVTRPYRIPILLFGAAFAPSVERRRFPESSYVKSFRSFRRQAASKGPTSLGPR